MAMRRWMILAAALAVAAPVRAESLVEVFKKVADSVVVIRATDRDASDKPGMVGSEETELGSGVLIDKDRVLTAAHVVQVADSIVVEVAGESIEGTVLTSEPSADLAVIQLARAPIKSSIATLGDSSGVKVGDEVFVVGAPLGMTHTLSVGHISGRRAAHTLFGGFAGAEMLQTDASINPGNSGGPMFDLNGNVIGIVSHIIFGEAGAGGLGFVVTSNLAKELVLTGRNFWSGMEGYALEGEMARVFQLPQSRGILVQRVAQGSPAAKLGLMPGHKKATIGAETFLVGGDVILEVQGIDVASPDASVRVREAMSSRDSASPMSVVVLRGGRRLELEWTPTPR
jgi:S1-C subfamily serine protease